MILLDQASDVNTFCKFWISIFIVFCGVVHHILMFCLALVVLMLLLFTYFMYIFVRC